MFTATTQICGSSSQLLRTLSRTTEPREPPTLNIVLSLSVPLTFTNKRYALLDMLPLPAIPPFNTLPRPPTPPPHPSLRYSPINICIITTCNDVSAFMPRTARTAHIISTFCMRTSPFPVSIRSVSICHTHLRQELPTAYAPNKTSAEACFDPMLQPQ